MKLLLDQNLSHHLVGLLAAEFPGTAHVRDLGLERSNDDEIWNVAKERGFTIVSKDADFHQRSFVKGHPPKVVWLRVGNVSTNQVLEIIKSRVQDLRSFDAEKDASFLVIS